MRRAIVHHAGGPQGQKIHARLGQDIRGDAAVLPPPLAWVRLAIIGGLRRLEEESPQGGDVELAYEHAALAGLIRVAAVSPSDATWRAVHVGGAGDDGRHVDVGVPHQLHRLDQTLVLCDLQRRQHGGASLHHLRQGGAFQARLPFLHDAEAQLQHVAGDDHAAELAIVADGHGPLPLEELHQSREACIRVEAAQLGGGHPGGRGSPPAAKRGGARTVTAAPPLAAQRLSDRLRRDLEQLSFRGRPILEGRGPAT
mmetsp:Transcript_90265/g.252309  ORF Transcript_90265/g.252309 Transcript_90265/m.252309 type:complete len:255 (-) Transcript_90265:293-1057(-)